MNMMNKPYSESCDQNREPILDIIAPIFSASSSVLEIGSGTGQHAVYFAENMPHLKWYTSDCRPYLDGINMWLHDAGLANVVAPIELDVTNSAWPKIDADAVFTANSIHIMNWFDVVNFMAGVGQLLEIRGDLVIYGPFNYDGRYTSESNERFDQWLKSRDPNSGIKHFEDLVSLADENRMLLVSDYEMPANNRILHFRKTESP
jgi:SAM-dependent methyltransferase